MAEDNASKRRDRTKLKWAVLFAFSVMIVELAGGYIAGSLAIMVSVVFGLYVLFLVYICCKCMIHLPSKYQTDAAHMLADVGGFGISIAASYITERQSNAA